jgi:hypothetical protein
MRQRGESGRQEGKKRMRKPGSQEILEAKAIAASAL